MTLFIGTTEIILILLIVLLLFGSKKIPEVARAMGKGFREFQKATAEIKREISNADITSDSKNVKENDQLSGNSNTSSKPAENQ